MASARAWVLNLDAELEMARPNGYQPSRSVTSAILGEIQQLGGLVAAEDWVLWPDRGDTARPKDNIHSVHCWCPTPSALRRLRRAGLPPPTAPAFPIVQQVNHRQFQAAVVPPLQGAHFVRTPAELASALAKAPADGVLCKRPYSFASRNARRIAPTRTQAQVTDDERWLTASLDAGGLWVEPWVNIVQEFALHGYLEQSGDVRLGQVCTQTVARVEGWQGSHLAERLAPHHVAALMDTGVLVAQALHQAGYFGPFGFDAFLWQDGSDVRLQPLSDLNARYTMGWAVGMSGSGISPAPST